MTRQNPFRKIENDLEDLESETDAEIEEYLVAHRDPQIGKSTTKDGEPVDPDDPTAYLLIIEDVLVMERERAEKDDRSNQELTSKPQLRGSLETR